MKSRVVFATFEFGIHGQVTSTEFFDDGKSKKKQFQFDTTKDAIMKAEWRLRSDKLTNKIK